MILPTARRKAQTTDRYGWAAIWVRCVAATAMKGRTDTGIGVPTPPDGADGGVRPADRAFRKMRNCRAESQRRIYRDDLLTLRS